MVENSTVADRPRRCVVVTTFWGEWHRRAFLDANLPTLLAPGNLPALVAGVDCEYFIYTTPEDGVEMKRDPAFHRLRGLLPVRLKRIEPKAARNIFELHHKIWRAATDYARRRDAFVLLMPPDVAWANGSLAQLGSALKSGKRAIFMTYPRVISETIIPDLTELYPRDADQAIVVSPSRMTALTLRHIHPLMAAHDRAASHFSIHPEMILWPVENNGFLLRLLARELFCFEPGRQTLNRQSLLAEVPPAEEIHVFQDSRVFLGVSLTPLWKDMEWYLSPNRLQILPTGRWWIEYDSPINDMLSRLNLRFAVDPIDEPRWRTVEAQADILFTALRSAREFIRILLAMESMACARAAAFLAAALRVQGLARRFPRRGPFIILVPTDETFERAGFVSLPGDGISAAAVRKLVDAHCAPAPGDGSIVEGQEVTTFSGRTVRLTQTEHARFSGKNILLPINAPVSDPPGSDSAERAAAGVNTVIFNRHSP